MDVQKLIEEVKAMSVLELNELVKALEAEFGVSAAAPVAAAGAAGAAEAAPAVWVLRMRRKPSRRWASSKKTSPKRTRTLSLRNSKRTALRQNSNKFCLSVEKATPNGVAFLSSAENVRNGYRRALKGKNIVSHRKGKDKNFLFF